MVNTGVIKLTVERKCKFGFISHKSFFKLTVQFVFRTFFLIFIYRNKTYSRYRNKPYTILIIKVNLSIFFLCCNHGDKKVPSISKSRCDNLNTNASMLGKFQDLC